MARFIAFYLPQYHPIKENNEWWGEGFTEWENVAKARPLFKNHYQPNIPADLGFYDLRLEETRIEQAKLAKEHGIEGFCYWHYWFGNGKRLLEKPFEEVLKSKKPDFPFCLAWANHSWERKTWDSKGTSEVLIEQKYLGEEDYKMHFESLLTAFKDERYLKVNGNIIFFIFNPLGSEEIVQFMNVWRRLAKENGLNGFHFIAKDADSRNYKKLMDLGFDATYNDDVFNIHHHKSTYQKIYYWFFREIIKRPTVFLYKDAVDYMVSDTCKNNNIIPVVAPNWDHSPRSAGKGIILHDSRPEYFRKVIRRALDVVVKKPKDEKLIIVKSWNEWGEGNYMEPDRRYGKENLKVLNDELRKNNSSK
ncbi:glycosyltransferase WbsX family protein [Chryseobacterium hagamense]|uniref:Lipopolysaccharide biosynthesis protein n=1 Tax=Chryseobacterium hagamense TaxID=395935 RepID=A0A511YLT3_9FLAO|nr:glycoside hydrolase family 99-like domain-containing protein [Chryseobacterium hagamense]GEN76165.1 hypothetical protein CHA01nite_19050 [Chryseobacterium hagamense]